ncbi:hypothetical protein JS80_13250 [Anoxybacillus sp. KU2-6(11)]|nr:hypothetical protein JS80_13250 [Anoxybacillus sp. KU2-6(11)]
MCVAYKKINIWKSSFLKINETGFSYILYALKKLFANFFWFLFVDSRSNENIKQHIKGLYLHHLYLK